MTEENWWDSEISRDLEDSIAAGGVTPRQLDPQVGEFLRRVAKIETMLAGATMAYFRPADDARAAELEALLSFHLSLSVLIELLPRFVASLQIERREWVKRRSKDLRKELDALRNFRNSLAHGDFWWDFSKVANGDVPALNVYSYGRSMKLKATEVTEELLSEWIGRAAEAMTVVGQLHYWLGEATTPEDDPAPAG